MVNNFLVLRSDVSEDIYFIYISGGTHTHTPMHAHIYICEVTTFLYKKIEGSTIKIYEFISTL